MTLPIAIHTAAQIRAMERRAIDELGIPGYALMSRAGAAAFRVLRARWPDARRIAVVCGSGNNAGDGYVLARLAQQAGFAVTTVALSDPNRLKGDALLAYREFVDAGGKTTPWPGQTLDATDVIVDAIFGTGLSRALDEQVRACVASMNAAAAPILALDIPSGLHADTGQVFGAAIKADCTVTFVGLKLGFYLGVAPDYVGVLEFDDLQIPSHDVAIERVADRISIDWLRTAIPPRSRLAHKGTNGHVLAIGGNIGMAGAIRMTSEAALRVGAGWVTVATRAENVVAIVIERPELMVRAVETAGDLEPLIARADVIAVGPGLGQDAWARSILECVLRSGKLLIVDADALNLLSQQPQRRDNWILTPHPGEASRLLAVSNAAVQQDRLSSARELARRYGGVAILKGANSWVAREDVVAAVCDRGNPAMATPGMGDVLTGVIAGLLAQVKDNWVAARAGVLAHAMAGDAATMQLGGGVDRGLIASDLFSHLPACFHS